MPEPEKDDAKPHHPVQTSYLPIWGQEALDKGYTLPNPYGLTISYMYMDQPLRVKSIELGGFPTPAVGDLANRVINDFLDISKATQDAHNFTLRADAWLFPFMNIYGVLGYTKGSSKAPMTCKKDDKTGPPLDRAILKFLGCTSIGKDIGDFKLDFEGPTFGAGMTLAGGIGNWFGSLDANYTRTSLNVLDGFISSVVAAPRVGYRFVHGPHDIRTWGGAMFQGVQQTLKGRLKDLNFGAVIPPTIPIGDAKFKVKQELTAQWNGIVGINYVYNRRIDVILEGGFGDRKSFFISIGDRF